MSVGMPELLLLQQFGNMLFDVFGEVPYHVGSSLSEKTGWRDVDVRIIIDDADYAAWGLGDPANTHSNPKWVALTLAFSVLGAKITGLPIDFQIQQKSWANETYKGSRSALFMTR